MEVNSSQMTSPGSDLPILFSAMVHIGIPIKIKGIKSNPMFNKGSWVDQDNRSTAKTPVKLPKVPGAGHFFPIGNSPPTYLPLNLPFIFNIKSINNPNNT